MKESLPWCLSCGSSLYSLPAPCRHHGRCEADPYWALAGLRIRHRFYHSFFSTQHSTIQKLSLKNALVRLSAVLAPKQSDDHTYTVGTCLLLVCFSIQSIFYRSKDGGDFVFHKPIWRLIGLLSHACFQTSEADMENGNRLNICLRLTFQDAWRQFRFDLCMFDMFFICDAHKKPHPLRFPRFFGPVEGTKLDE